MINIAFEGGLGNQMFQYAYARYLQQKWNENVKYDASKYAFGKNEERNFELKSFNIDAEWEKVDLKRSRFSRFGLRYLMYLIATVPYVKINTYIKKKNKKTCGNEIYQGFINFWGFYRIHFGEYIEPRLSSFKNKYVRGHWFFPEVVIAMDEVIRKELRVITPIKEKNRSVLEKINTTNSVGVHIRRGDYVTLGLVICDIEYYKRCMRKMANIVENPAFYIFSDDIDWVKENLDTEYETIYIDNNNTSPEDMQLLYNCKYFIMSNSTFSWWGAYLGDYRDKKVIVPEVWAKGGKRSKLILDEWIIEKTI